MAAEDQDLRLLLKEKDKEISALRDQLSQLKSDIPQVIKEKDASFFTKLQVKGELSNGDISRYSRQLILPEIGVMGQKSLRETSVLVVGCGGLGCPAAIYMAAAGVGRIGLVDYDEVELSNLHRQVLHAESRVNVSKSASAAFACNQLNSSIECLPYQIALDSNNALDLIEKYDIILDCTDNVATRYLLNDACVLAQKTLVSGSALRFEGQLTIYNHQGGPCYRCLFPKPPPPEMVTNCSDGGVLGVVPGIIGCLQALEAIKLGAGLKPSYSQAMLLFDALDGKFQTIRLRSKQKKCIVCGDSPSITKLIDYEQFCGARATDKDQGVHILDEGHRISVREYKEVLDRNDAHVLLDVRLPVELEICKLPMPDVLNIPIADIEKPGIADALKDRLLQSGNAVALFVVCRRGNDSQIAVQKLKKILEDAETVIKDIKGGLHAWAKHIDQDFPVY